MTASRVAPGAKPKITSALAPGLQMRAGPVLSAGGAPRGGGPALRMKKESISFWISVTPALPEGFTLPEEPALPAAHASDRGVATISPVITTSSSCEASSRSRKDSRPSRSSRPDTGDPSRSN